MAIARFGRLFLLVLAAVYASFALALNPGANIISCQRTDFFMPQITPGGDWNNITINITNGFIPKFVLIGF
jgi:hypothetical protein